MANNIPRHSPFTVCFVDNEVVLGQCVVKSHIRYGDFLVVLHDLTKPFAHNIPDLPAAKEIGEGLSLNDGDWWYRTLRPAPVPLEMRKRSRYHCQPIREPIKGDWQILNCGAGFDKLMAQVTLGPKAVGSWIEVQHQWQKQRCANDWTSARIKFKGPLIVDGSKGVPETVSSSTSQGGGTPQSYPTQIHISRVGAATAKEPGAAMPKLIQYGHYPAGLRVERYSALSGFTKPRAQPSSQGHTKVSFSPNNGHAQVDTGLPDVQPSSARRVTFPQTRLIDEIENNTAKRMRLAKGPKSGMFPPPKPRQHPGSLNALPYGNGGPAGQNTRYRFHEFPSLSALNRSKFHDITASQFRPPTMTQENGHFHAEQQPRPTNASPPDQADAVWRPGTSCHSYRHESNASNPYSEDPPIDPVLLRADLAAASNAAGRAPSVGVARMPAGSRFAGQGVAQPQTIPTWSDSSAVSQESGYDDEDHRPSCLDPALEFNHRHGVFPPAWSFPHGHIFSVNHNHNHGPAGGHGTGPLNSNETRKTKVSPDAVANLHHRQPQLTHQRLSKNPKALPCTTGAARPPKAESDRIVSQPQPNGTNTARPEKTTGKRQSKKKNKKLKLRTKKTEEADTVSDDDTAKKPLVKDEQKDARSQRAARRESVKTAASL